MMAIYSNYYGASIERGIGVQAQSRELENLPIRSTLKNLSSMHALESSEHQNEMLSYMLAEGGYHILGLSYIESPKNSGYGRSAPCGLQYIASSEEVSRLSAELGKIINFVNFQKPTSAVPAPLNAFPVNESGFYYHNNPSVLAPLVDGLVRVALSSAGEVLLVALPRGKNNEYATARYTIAEALGYLPQEIRTRIRFFTGLPVAENVSDPLAGFDNAIRFGANVVFCPNEFYQRIKSHRTCIGMDMDCPGQQMGAFAKFIACESDVSYGLSMVESCLSGSVTYDALNRATQRVLRGEVVTIDMIRSELEDARVKLMKSEEQCKALEKQAANMAYENNSLQAHYKSLETQYKQLTAQYEEMTKQARKAPPQQSYQAASKQASGKNSKRTGGGNKKLLFILIALWSVVLIGATAFLTATILPGKDKLEEQPVEGAVVNNTIVVPENTEIPVFAPAPTSSPAPEATATVAPTSLTPTVSPSPEPISDDAETAGTSEQQLNQYGRTNAAVNLRPFNNTDHPKIVTLAKNEVVWMLSAADNEQGENWTHVNYKGMNGYIMSQYLDVLSQEDADAYLNEQVASTAAPAPEATAVTESPIPFPTAFQAEPEFNPAAETWANGQIINRYGKAKVKVNLRQGNSKNHAIVDELLKDDYVWVIKVDNAADDEQWMQVIYNGKNGYIMSEFLNILSQEESDAYNNAQASPVPFMAESLPQTGTEN